MTSVSSARDKATFVRKQLCFWICLPYGKLNVITICGKTTPFQNLQLYANIYERLVLTIVILYNTTNTVVYSVLVVLYLWC